MLRRTFVRRDWGNDDLDLTVVYARKFAYTLAMRNPLEMRRHKVLCYTAIRQCVRVNRLPGARASSEVLRVVNVVNVVLASRKWRFTFPF